MTSITYINSILDMESPLMKRKVLAVKGNKAARGESVTPTLKISKDQNLDFISKAVNQIKIAMKARKMSVPESTVSTSKYKAKIT